MRWAPATGEGPTIDALFRWLLGLAAVGSALVVLWGLAMLGAFLVAGIPVDLPLAAEYVGVPAAVALVNVGAWRLWRRAPFVGRNAMLLVVANSLLATADYLLVLRTYHMSITSLELPVFLFTAMLAGILLDFRGGLAVATLLAAEHAVVILAAIRLDAQSDSNALPFLGAAVALFYAFTLPAGYISRQLQESERRLGEAQASLSRFVSPQLAEHIRGGDAAGVIRRERRKVTLLFADIKDFTATADAMEPEDMARILDEYLDEMIRIAIAHKGTVGQISGDGMFVFFGAPDFEDDRKHALDCVSMAVAMQRRMTELQAGWFARGIEHPFRIRCGINTGMVTIGSFGSELRRDYTAIGLQVNLAARLQAACEPGNVVLSHSTWGLVNERYRCDDGGEIEVKGFHRPLRVWRLRLAEAEPEAISAGGRR